MDKKFIRESLEKYVDNIVQIRIMSAVETKDVACADEYSEHLKKDYKRIGELGIECRQILSDVLYPLLKQEDILPQDLLIKLQEFCGNLLEPMSGEELDLSLLFEVSNKILSDYKAIGDDSKYIKQAHIHVNVCYANVNRTARITVTKDLTTFYRDEGLKAAHIVLEYIKNKDKFLTLNNEARKSALTVARFYSALYDTFYSSDETNQARFQALIDAINLYDDNFYRSNVEDYNWELHKYRCIEHMGQLTERGNRWKFSIEKCNEICDWLDILKAFMDVNTEAAINITPMNHLRLELLRNRYFAGRIEKSQYQDSLLELYEECDSSKYDMHSVQMNLLIPAEYMYTLKNERISARIEKRLVKIYDKVIDYLINSVNRDAFNYLQEYLMAFWDMFIELPGKMTFQDMGLYCIAALHPPTYVHSRQVADISKCFAEYLLDMHPELFIDEFGYKDIEDVLNNRSKIISFVYNGAICHDFGKLTMIDSIFVYGRNLLDAEYEIIKSHPNMGAQMLSRFESTKMMADVARQHHIWYNGQGKYSIETSALYPVSKNIVEAADCIDAATDIIGRSYNKCKSLDEVRKEIIDGCGSRYAPYIVELLKDEDVVGDIDYILNEGRQDSYKQTFLLLTGVKTRLYS